MICEGKCDFAISFCYLTTLILGEHSRETPTCEGDKNFFFVVFTEIIRQDVLPKKVIFKEILESDRKKLESRSKKMSQIPCLVNASS